MADPKKATPRAADSSKVLPPKKPYIKPALRRLGTVRELTQALKTGFE
jgi:hypothetical protein